MEYYKVHGVGSGRVGKVVEGGVRPLECPNDALCLKRVAVFQALAFFFVCFRKCFLDIVLFFLK